MSVCCTAGPFFVSAGSGWPRDVPPYHWLLPISCQDFQDCKSASGHESGSCKQRYSKYTTFTFTFAFKKTVFESRFSNVKTVSASILVFTQDFQTVDAATAKIREANIVLQGRWLEKTSCR